MAAAAPRRRAVRRPRLCPRPHAASCPPLPLLWCLPFDATLPLLFPLPLCLFLTSRGSGLVEVAYLDADLRIFRALNGSLSLQVRRAQAPRLLGAAWRC